MPPNSAISPSDDSKEQPGVSVDNGLGVCECLPKLKSHIVEIAFLFQTLSQLQTLTYISQYNEKVGRDTVRKRHEVITRSHSTASKSTQHTDSTPTSV